MAISLNKGQTLSLQKSDGSALSKVTLGLGWDVAKTKRGLFGGNKEIDLDASAIIFDGAGRALDTVWYGGLKSTDGSVKHAGDNLTGEGDGDDEQIFIDLNRVDSKAKSIVFVITSYSGDKFDSIKNVFARVVDDSTGAELVRYQLAEGGSNTASVVAKLTRTASGWEFAAIGEPTNGKTVNDVTSVAARFL